MLAANDFFTPESLASLAGASLAVTVAANVVGSFFDDESPKRVARLTTALVTSFVVSIGLLVFFGPDPLTAQDWFVAVVNSMLVFSTAAGINQLAAGGVGKQGRAAGFSTSWFKRP
jgi:hypothetical protein